MKAINDINDPRLVKALAHPLRVRILGVLQDRVASPSDLAEELKAPLGNVSYHVRILAQLGLLKLVKKRPRRGAIEHYTKIIKSVEGIDYVTQDMVIQILKDEEGHRRLFEGFLREYESEGAA